MIVKKTSVFLASKDEVFDRLQQLKTLQYVAYPLATFTPVNEDDTSIWRADTETAYNFKLFGIIPFGVHSIKVIRFSLEEGIYTHESNKHVPVWNHEIIIEKIDNNSTKYTDIVEIKAGWKTIFVYLWAKCFYAHRQRRWLKLLKNRYHSAKK